MEFQCKPARNYALPNLALLDKRVHVTTAECVHCDKLNVNKQLEQTKTGLPVIPIIVVAVFFYKDIAALSLLNV